MADRAPDYANFEIIADMVKRDAGGAVRFEVRCECRPSGQITAAVETIVPPQLNDTLAALEDRRLGEDELMQLGSTLTDILLPRGEPSRTLLQEKVEESTADNPLRLRLRLPSTIAHIPWEYMYLQHDPDRGNSTNFLALDSRLSIVRQNDLSVPTNSSEARSIWQRLLVASASPSKAGYAAVDQKRERVNIERALAGITDIGSEFLSDTTVEQLREKVRDNPVDVFHFCGYAEFSTTDISAESGDRLGKYPGSGKIILVDKKGQPVPLGSYELATLLRDKTQLVVLGGSTANRKGGINAWNGIVPALMSNKIPAAIAMQYDMLEESMVLFIGKLYKELAQGSTLDRAVTLGRTAIFDRCRTLDDARERAKVLRDWGAPALYYRSYKDIRLVNSKPVGQAGRSGNVSGHTHDDYAELISRLNLNKLRKGISGNFSDEDLEILCAHLSEDFRTAQVRVDQKLDLDTLGGRGVGEEVLVLRLIQWLQNRRLLHFLIEFLKQDSRAFIVGDALRGTDGLVRLAQDEVLTFNRDQVTTMQPERIAGASEASAADISNLLRDQAQRFTEQ